MYTSTGSLMDGYLELLESDRRDSNDQVLRKTVCKKSWRNAVSEARERDHVRETWKRTGRNSKARRDVKRPVHTVTVKRTSTSDLLQVSPEEC